MSRKSDRFGSKGLLWLAVLAFCASVPIFFHESPVEGDLPENIDDTMIVNADDLVIPKNAPNTKTLQTKPDDDKNVNVESALQWKSVVIQPGDNLSLIFLRLKLPKSILNKIIALDKTKRTLPRLRPGQIIKFGLRDKSIVSVVIEINALSSLWFEKIDGELTSRKESIEPTIRLATASSVITQSLFTDGQQAGLSDATIMQLTEIFAWDIDFALDLRPGDSFSVIYEKVYKSSEFLRAGKILAAEFVNKGKVLRAAIYPISSNDPVFYAPNGQAMKKAFLRAPVKFSRISSRFNLKRRHPILNKIRTHNVVDHTLALGTPERATSEGKVKSIGWNGGYGKTIVLAHGHRYSTLYAHLGRYNRKLKVGSYVSQGRIIGYVGKTGLATGPHLHYEFRVNGKHKNPLTAEFPPAEPIADKKYADFKKQTGPLFKHLDVIADNQKNNTKRLANLNTGKKPQNLGHSPSHFN